MQENVVMRIVSLVILCLSVATSSAFAQSTELPQDLLDLLHHRKEQSRSLGITKLSKVRAPQLHPQCIAELKNLIENDKKAAIRIEATRALRSFPTQWTAVEPILMSLMAEKNEDLVVASIETITGFGTPAKSLEPTLIKAHKTNSSLSVRSAIYKALKQLGSDSDAFLELLFQGIVGTKSRGSRYEKNYSETAINILRGFKPRSRVASLLLKQCNHEDSGTIQRIASILSTIFVASAEPELTKTLYQKMYQNLSSSDRNERKTSLLFFYRVSVKLTQSQKINVVSGLINFMDEKDKYVQATAVSAFRRYPEIGFNRLLQSLSESKSKRQKFIVEAILNCCPDEKTEKKELNVYFNQLETAYQSGDDKAKVTILKAYDELTSISLSIQDRIMPKIRAAEKSNSSKVRSQAKRVVKNIRKRERDIFKPTPFD